MQHDQTSPKARVSLHYNYVRTRREDGVDCRVLSRVRLGDQTLLCASSFCHQRSQA